VATDKRERQKANRQVKVEQQRKEAKQEAVKKRGLFLGTILAVVLGGLFLIYLTSRGGNDDTEATDSTLTILAGDEGPDDADSTTTSSSLAETTTTTPGTEPVSAVSAPPPGAGVTGETECPESDGSSERVTSFENAPPMCIQVAGAPNTVNNFVVLARYHYYDGVPFHRIIPDFVIQGGDAVGDPLGTGDPGYSFADELPADDKYQIGSLAMANSGPDTNGSQFFVITGDEGTQLPPSYSLFGMVTDGLDVVETIEAIPTTAQDAPTESIVIESVTITES
jgi:cyclophilin family peptidyl-prolyl cis-trans isomerase